MSGASTGYLEGHYFHLEFTDGLSVSPEGGDYSHIIEQGERYSTLLKKGAAQFEALVEASINEDDLPLVEYTLTDSIDGTVIDDAEIDDFNEAAMLKQQLLALEQKLSAEDEAGIPRPIFSFKENNEGEAFIAIEGVNDQNRHLLPVIKKQIEIKQLERMNSDHFDHYFRESKLKSVNVWHQHAMSDPHYFQFTIRLSVTGQVRRTQLARLAGKFEQVLIQLLQDNPDI